MNAGDIDISVSFTAAIQRYLSVDTTQYKMDSTGISDTKYIRSTFSLGSSFFKSIPLIFIHAFLLLIEI